MSQPGGTATAGLSCLPGSRVGRGGTGKQGSGAPKVTEQDCAITESVCFRQAPRTTMLFPGGCRSPPWKTSSYLLCLRTGAKVDPGSLKKSCMHWTQNFSSSCVF